MAFKIYVIFHVVHVSKNKCSTSKSIFNANTFYSLSRHDIFEFFSHPEFGHPKTGLGILNNNSVWTENMVYQHNFGACHTYDPPFSSPPDHWYGLW